MDCKNEQGEHVIIIGAGISGLRCWERLRELGHTKVTILEARDRVGGRMFTDQITFVSSFF